MNKEEFEEYDLKHQIAMLSIKVHRFEKKHGRKIKFNGRENARFDRKLVKCFNCKKMGHFSRECRAQGGQNSNNYQKYKEAGKDGTDSKAMVVVDGSIDWDKQTEEGNIEPRSLENFGMVVGLEIASDADSEGEVVSADDVIPADVSVSTDPVAAAAVSPHYEIEFALMGLSTEVSILVTYPLCCDSKYKLIEEDYQGQREQLNDCVVDLKAHKHDVKSLEKQIKCHQTNQLAYEEKIRVLSYKLEEKSNILEYKQKLIDQATQEKNDLMTKLDNKLANQAKWNNSGKNLYKLIDSSMLVRTKRGFGLDRYIREGELGIDDSVFSIFHTNSDDLEGKPIYNRFASVDHMKAVLPPLIGNYMPPSNIPDIDESQMVYGKKATDSSEIKTNDDSISHSYDSVLFDFSDRSSKPSTNDFQTCDSSQECSRPNHSDHDSNDSISSVSAPESKSRDTIVIDCARQEDFPGVCTSSIETNVKSSNTYYLHLIKDCDLYERRLVKRNAERKGKLGRRPTGKPLNPNRPKPVSAGQQNPVFAGQQNTVSAGQPNPVFAGQQNTVSAGPPNPVYAGQPNPVYAGDGILGP
nr:ribonuclease H-like domain-containing protein [Tanacetum cinerariifolium]